MTVSDTLLNSIIIIIHIDPPYLLSEDMISTAKPISSANVFSDEVKSERVLAMVLTALTLSSSFRLFIALVIFVT